MTGRVTAPPRIPRLPTDCLNGMRTVPELIKSMLEFLNEAAGPGPAPRKMHALSRRASRSVSSTVRGMRLDKRTEVQGREAQRGRSESDQCPTTPDALRL